jgi:hypothetical protein
MDGERTPRAIAGTRDPTVFSFHTTRLPSSFLATPVRPAHRTGPLPPRLPRTVPPPLAPLTARGRGGATPHHLTAGLTSSPDLLYIAGNKSSLTTPKP